jgi:type I restriction enzyme R subunit
LKKILEEYKENWEQLAQELEKLTSEIRKGRESEQTFGFDPKKKCHSLVIKTKVFGKQL